MIPNVKYALCLSVMLLNGCKSIGLADSYCEIAKPIYVAKADSFTDGTARQILEHNETGAGVCNWNK
jgi:hypothetical protein